MCNEYLEALEEIPKKIPEIPKIPIPDEPIRRTDRRAERRAETDVKDPIPHEPIVKEIATATPVNQVHNHYNLSGLMKQINIFIVLCFLAVAMYISMQPSSDELVCLPAPPVTPPASVMYLK